MSSTSHANSRQVESSGDDWTNRFLHELQLAAEAKEAAEKTKRETTKRVVSREQVSDLLVPQ
jgi:hypothetical protein